MCYVGTKTSEIIAEEQGSVGTLDIICNLYCIIVSRWLYIMKVLIKKKKWSTVFCFFKAMSTNGSSNANHNFQFSPSKIPIQYVSEYDKYDVATKFIYIKTDPGSHSEAGHSPLRAHVENFLFDEGFK